MSDRDPQAQGAPGWLVVLLVVVLGGGGLLAALAVGGGILFVRRREEARAAQELAMQEARRAAEQARQREAGEVTCLRLETLRAELLKIRRERGSYPPSTGGPEPFEGAGSGTDGWGRPIRYTLREGGEGFELRSFGVDGKEGGEGYAADFVATSE